jgi:O-antigen/teichoic acid export membrane protein
MDSLRTNIPRYFIAGYIGEYELGIFATMAYLKKAGNIIIIALGLAAAPRLAGYYASRSSLQYRKLLLRTVAFGLLVGASGVLVCAIAGPQLMTLLYRPEYAAYNEVLVLLMLAAAIDFVATFIDYGINAARYFKVQVPLLAAVLGTAVLGCVWLVPAHGIRGAALAVVLSTLVRLVIALAVIMHALQAMHKTNE